MGQSHVQQGERMVVSKALEGLPGGGGRVLAEPGHAGHGVQGAWEEGKRGHREVRREYWAVVQRMTKFWPELGGVGWLRWAYLGHGINESLGLLRFRG